MLLELGAGASERGLKCKLLKSFHLPLVLETNSDLPRHNNVYIVNLLLCKDINVKKEVNGAEHQEPQSINLQKVEYFVIPCSTYREFANSVLFCSSVAGSVIQWNRRRD